MHAGSAPELSQAQSQSQDGEAVAKANDWSLYDPGKFFDELFAETGKARAPSEPIARYLQTMSDEEIADRKAAADLAIKVMGISFTVYQDGATIDRDWPFDIIPRVIPASEWRQIEAGLKQRAEALNLFIADVYGEQRIVKDGRFPAELLEDSVNYRKQCEGVQLPNNVWAHICGSDLVRDGDGTVYVLEDNLRVPSGVAYMLENREVLRRCFPELFRLNRILPVNDYPSALFDTLAEASPRPGTYPTIVVLTPGVFNSAYFEHAHLAQQMGLALVEGRDLFVDDDDSVYMRTIRGPKRVDVIYRRVDDLFIDPEVFRPDSTLGVPGLMRAWRAGKVGLVNAPGAGVADDKVVYAYVPDMIRYYLDAEPLLATVPTYLCDREKDRKHVLANMEKLVMKPANESGGYGLLVGPKSTPEQRERMATAIERDPRNWVAQPTLALSTSPTLCDGELAPRHVDLRPFILSGKGTYVTNGGLTRVALTAGSLVVNSSQGGGSKDTWIVEQGDKA